MNMKKHLFEEVEGRIQECRHLFSRLDDIPILMIGLNFPQLFLMNHYCQLGRQPIKNKLDLKMDYTQN